MQELPRSWRLRQDLGFFYFLFLQDSQKASRVMLEAAQVPGAPGWLLEALSADLLLQGGDRRTARRMWAQMYEQAEQGIIRENAKLRLQVLDGLDQADALAAAVREYERRLGRKPATLAALQAAGYAPVPIRDSSGEPFAYDPATGQVGFARTSSLWRPALAGAHRRPKEGGGLPAPPSHPGPQGEHGSQGAGPAVQGEEAARQRAR